MLVWDMNMLLNEVTCTAHKHKRSKSGFQTECGIHHHLSHDDLRLVSAEQPMTTTDVSKCGRCFDGEGGY